jgi:hypothetical protein
MSVGYLVIDSRLGTRLTGTNEHQRYRSASLVKLLIALDYLESRWPDVPHRDRELLEAMSRASDDAAASELWVRGGGQDIVRRMMRRIGLADTAPPEPPGMWGYTATSATDVTKIYQYLLNETDLSIRELLMGDLRGWTKRAADGFDQSFGVPSAVREPGAIKQGWSWGATAPQDKTGVTGGSGEDLDLIGRAMHTSGTIGRDDGRIFAILTLHSPMTPWPTCAQRITALTRAIAQAAGCVVSDEGNASPDTTAQR